MALLGIVLLVSSVMLWVVLPQGYFRSRLVWLEIHKWSGLALTFAAVLHLLLHRRWLWRMTARHFGLRKEHPPTAEPRPD
jgi:cytochrome b subunit of formate dehydrogenase